VTLRSHTTEINLNNINFIERHLNMRFNNPKIILGSAALITLLLAACGSGGGGSTGAPAPKTFAYVANSTSNDVSAYTIDSSTGALTQIKCTSATGCGATIATNFAAGNAPNSVAVDPYGRFAYVANLNSNDVSAYTIDPTSGVLTQTNCVTGCNTSVGYTKNFSAGTNPISVTVDHTGKFAFVANAGSNDVSAYFISQTTGALTQVPCNSGCSTTGNTNDFTAGTTPVSVIVDPTGTYAYVANQGSSDVSAYTINASTGAITQIDCGSGIDCNTRNFVTGTYPSSVTTDFSGNVYVANAGSSDVSVYNHSAAYNASLLVRFPCSNTFSHNCNTAGIAWDYLAGTNPASITVAPSGTFAYVANSGSNDISAFTISFGYLLNIGTSTVPAGNTPASVTVDPSNKFAYVANKNSNDISVYTINASTGALTQVDCGGGTGCNTSGGYPKNFMAGSNPISITTTLR
jgi:6-phosphogluconolactonase